MFDNCFFCARVCGVEWSGVVWRGVALVYADSASSGRSTGVSIANAW